MFKSTKWSHRFLTVSDALPLIDGSDENVTSLLRKVSLIKVFIFRSLSKISLDLGQVVGGFKFA